MDYTKVNVEDVSLYATAKNNTLIFECLECVKTEEKETNQGLKKFFQNKYWFCDGGINKFYLMYWKDVYSYE